jgi:membrane fusion protein, multidrug efflux system
MKAIQLIIFSAALMLSACGKKNNTGDKATQLTELKKQRDELNTKIKDLEKETGTKEAGISSGETKIKEVATTPVAKTRFDHNVEVQGKVDSDKNVQVSPEMGGIITKVNVSMGDKVKKGQVLAELDATVIAHSMEEVKGQLNYAKLIYDKQKILWDQKIGSEVQYLTAKNNKESLENKMSTLQRQYNMSKVKSPIDGVIDESKARQGEATMAGLPLFRVVNLSDFKVVAEIAEAYLHEINIGDEVLVILPDAGQEIKAKVTDKSNAIDAMNRTFKIEIALKGNNMVLRPNMIAKVKINDYSNASAIVAPINTVQESDAGTYVYVAEKANENYKVKKQFVKTGKSYLDMVEIKDGLQPGDLLITTGFQDLAEGQLIKF